MSVEMGEKTILLDATCPFCDNHSGIGEAMDGNWRCVECGTDLVAVELVGDLTVLRVVDRYSTDARGRIYRPCIRCQRIVLIPEHVDESDTECMECSGREPREYVAMKAICYEDTE